MKSLLYMLLGLVVLATACQQAPTKPLEIHTLFADGMVMQRNTSMPIWGQFTPGGTVTVEASWGERASGSADFEGRWMLNLSTPDAGGPYEFTVATSDSSLVISDVLSGEVWLASGQSNMQMPVKGWPPRDPIVNSAEEIAAANFPEIRMITVPRTTSITPETTFEGTWQTATAQNIGDFSATAYFFARELHQELGVPIGIIHTSWGGTVAEAWASKEKLLTLGDFNATLRNLAEPEAIQKSEAWFANRQGVPIPTTSEAWVALNWSAPNAGDVGSGWDQVELPGTFDDVDSSALDGAFWLQKSIEVADPSGDYVLTLGAVDDMDMVYINGQSIGMTMESGKYQDERRYPVPAGVLEQGTNVVTILGVDTGGPGAVNEPMTLSNNRGISLALEGAWDRRIAGERFGPQFFAYGPNEDLSLRPPVMRIHQNMPSILFNGMISPLIPYSIKGAIWYQGESNVGRAEQYTRLFPAMITDWRERWGQDFSFYFVQIAPYNYNELTNPSPALRDAQRRSLELQKTGMAVTLDIGNPSNIHPGNKQDVGKRLAFWALAQDYGQDIVPSGPLFTTAEVDGKQMIVSFDYATDGLSASEGGLEGFELAGADGNFFPAQARIDTDKVVVASRQVSEPVVVRYAYKDISEASLFNSAGLPASSFTSEDKLP